LILEWVFAVILFPLCVRLRPRVIRVPRQIVKEQCCFEALHEALCSVQRLYFSRKTGARTIFERFFENIFAFTQNKFKVGKRVRFEGESGKPGTVRALPGAPGGKSMESGFPALEGARSMATPPRRRLRPEGLHGGWFRGAPWIPGSRRRGWRNTPNSPSPWLPRCMAKGAEAP
jgi:hypothetical protein